MSKMFHCENRLVMKQYVRCIITIARFDYPENWPSLTQNISEALQSGNDKGILTGLISLFCLVKKYEYELDDSRQQLYDIMQQVSGILGSICEQYMS